MKQISQLHYFCCMNTRILILISGLLLGIGSGCVAKKTRTQPEFKKEISPIPHQIFIPGGSKQNKWPLIIFLHGSGERGKDNQKQTVHVYPYLTSDSVQKRYPSIVVAPQCPENDYWAPVNRFEWSMKEGGRVTPAMASVIRLIKKLRKHPNVDKRRIYIIGLSMGGFGTFDLISRKPEWFAAAVPICGGADLKKTGQFEKVPLWVFHGEKDSVVPVKLSRDLVESLTSEGLPVRYTEYADENHGIWERAVREPGFLEWLFSQRVANR